MLSSLLYVALGSAFGGVARYAVSSVMARRFGEAFPWGTIAVNVSGAFLIGVFAAMASRDGGLFARPEPWLFAVTGFLGCYTTVSSFSLQTLSLARNGEALRAAGNVAISVLLCLGAVAGGFAMMETLVR